MIETDIIVIGAGMAGASVAAHLAESQRVVLLEREERAGYHATGRSAALFTEIYGNAVIRALTRASRPFLFDPVPGFAESALTHPRGCLYIATAEQLEALQRFAALPDIAPATRWLSAAEARGRCPILREGYVSGALLEPDSSDIEVHGLHHGYLRLFRQRSGRFINNAAVESLERDTRGWTVRAGARIAAGADCRQCRRRMGGRDCPIGRRHAGRPRALPAHCRARRSARRHDGRRHGRSSTTSTSSFISSPTRVRCSSHRPTKRPPYRGTHSPMSGISRSPSIESRPQRRCRFTASRRVGRVCGPSRRTAPRWSASRRKPRGSSGSPDKGVMEFKRRRPYHGRRPPSSGDCRCRRISSQQGSWPPTCRRCAFGQRVHERRARKNVGDILRCPGPSTDCLPESAHAQYGPGSNRNLSSKRCAHASLCCCVFRHRPHRGVFRIRRHCGWRCRNRKSPVRHFSDRRDRELLDEFGPTRLRGAPSRPLQTRSHRSTQWILNRRLLSSQGKKYGERKHQRFSRQRGGLDERHQERRDPGDRPGSGQGQDRVGCRKERPERWGATGPRPGATSEPRPPTATCATTPGRWSGLPPWSVSSSA